MSIVRPTVLLMHLKRVDNLSSTGTGRAEYLQNIFIGEVKQYETVATVLVNFELSRTRRRTCQRNASWTCLTYRTLAFLSDTLKVGTHVKK